MLTITSVNDLDEVEVDEVFKTTNTNVIQKMDKINKDYAKNQVDGCIFVVVDDLENTYKKVN